MNLFQFLGQIPNKPFKDLDIPVRIDPKVEHHYEMDDLNIKLIAIADGKYTIQYSDGYKESLYSSGGTAIDLIVDNADEEIAKLNLQN